MEWHADSWRAFPISQQTEYPVSGENILDDLNRAKPIVEEESICELLRLFERIISSSESQVFLHAGDCAETFESCTAERFETDIAHLTEISNLFGASFIVGRMCGQFAKPRSVPFQEHPSLGRIPPFRGDIINSRNALFRTPSPSRMRTAYSLCARMFPHVKKAESFFISHECLLLPYEAALVRSSSSKQQHFFAGSAHMLWIGDRTRQLDGAHIEFCRGIMNPVGIKVGPDSDPQEIKLCVERLNPSNRKGKVSVITRYGAGNVTKALPSLIEALRGLHVLFQCDPMHGNTVIVDKFKTRHLDTIKAEIEETIDVHKHCQSRMHALHLETTGDDVTECIGLNVTPSDLKLRYRTACDPRLNPQQAKDIVQFTRALLSDSPKRTTLSPGRSSSGSTSCSCPVSDEDSSL